MIFYERTYSVLLVSANGKFNTALSALLPCSEYYPVDRVDNVGAARRLMLERSYDILIINSPLPDDDGMKLAADAAASQTVTLLFVRSDLYEDVLVKTVRSGIFTMSKPTSPQAVRTALSWLCTARELMRSQEQKTVSIEEKMAEIRLVNRAKWLLISELKMTEGDAHKYIEKQAMDNCTTRREIAEKIIKTYS